MSNVIETAAVRGLTLELVPGRQWRQAAKSGRKSMNYRISGTIGTPAGDHTAGSFQRPLATAVRAG